ncbi:MAG: SDR family oxidoreductase [Thiolinea sp.]
MPTVLITGANRGIGLELTRQYAADGWQVHACCRSPEQADALNTLAAQSGKGIQVHQLDVCNDQQRTALAQQLSGQPLDILFNNAGIYGNWDYQGFGKTNAQEWENVFRANVIAPMQMMEAFVDNVAASEQKIIANMTSKMGSMGDNSGGTSYLYRSSKAAMNAIGTSAAIDLRDRGIKVALLHPGWVQTDMGGPNGELTVAQSATALRRNLANMTDADNGRFQDIDGTTIPW